MLRTLSLAVLALALSSATVMAQAHAYAITSQSGSARLSTFDISTGRGTIIGGFSFLFPEELEWGGSPPALWGLSHDGVLGTISTSNATGTVRRLLALEYFTDLAWSPTRAEFWMLRLNGLGTWMVHAYTPATNTVRTIGSFPVGAIPESLAFDQAGNLWCLAQDALYLIDPQNLSLRIVSFTDRRILQLSIDQASGTFLAVESATSRYVEVDPATGITRPLALPLLTGPISAWTIVPGICTGRFLPTGPSCPGTGGIAPVLDGFGCYGSGGTVHLSLSQAMSGTTGFLLFGLDAASVPLGNGCTLNIGPVFADPLLPLPLFGTGGAGRGFTTVSFTVPTGTLVAPLALQALIFDLGAPGSIAATNGLRIVLS
ncbi:MAG: hypothetical protein IPN34_15320 [Planctomycetes bacterium]|nr:hypothetical protein [Planctomycetota bacterium]